MSSKPEIHERGNKEKLPFRVPVEIEETMLCNDYGREIEGIIVTCTRCDHSVEVFGTHEGSVRRACVMLDEDCRSGNFYFHEDYDD